MTRAALAVLLAAALAGCAPSLYPVYTEKDLVFEPALVGTWSTDDPKDGTWSVEKRGENRARHSVRCLVTNGWSAAEWARSFSHSARISGVMSFVG